jgi:hypothetical protein
MKAELQVEISTISRLGLFQCLQSWRDITTLVPPVATNPFLAHSGLPGV